MFEEYGHAQTMGLSGKTRSKKRERERERPTLRFLTEEATCTEGKPPLFARILVPHCVEQDPSSSSMHTLTGDNHASDKPHWQWKHRQYCAGRRFVKVTKHQVKLFLINETIYIFVLLF